MKADLTLPENRAAFDSQYYGQDVRYEDGEYKEVTTEFIKQVRYFNERTPLSLRHISSLTEDESVTLAEIMGIHGPLPFKHKYTSMKERVMAIIEYKMPIAVRFFDMKAACDKLIEWGYLIPWRGNSCDDLIASGVAVYREERKEGA